MSASLQLVANNNNTIDQGHSVEACANTCAGSTPISAAGHRRNGVTSKAAVTMAFGGHRTEVTAVDGRSDSPMRLPA